MTEVFFENIQGKILDELDKANKIIRIAVAWVNDSFIINKINELASKSICVELLMADDILNKEYDQVKFDIFSNEIFNTKLFLFPKNDAFMHNKFCIIDEETIITGSYNWTNYAPLNRENITVIKSEKKIINQFIKEFEKLKKDSKEYIYENFKLNEIDKIQIKSKYNYESEFLRNELDEFCLKNGITEVPVTAKAYAIFLLENRLNPIPETNEYEKVFEILNGFSWQINSNSFVKNPVNEDFLYQIKKEVIIENDVDKYFQDLPNANIEEKIKRFEWLALLISTNNEIKRSLIIRLYYYYLTRFKEFLPVYLRPKKFNPVDNEIDFSIYDDSIIKFYEKIKNIAHEFEVKKTYIISDVYDFIKKSNQELKSLKNKISSNEKIYTVLASRNIKYANELLLSWMESYSGNLSKNSLEICKQIITEIKSIETDEGTKNWLEDQYKTRLNKVLNGNSSSPCYIATTVYGDFNHPQVVYLREFRDKYLNEYLLGRIFIHFYYFISPKMILLFRNNLFVKDLIKNQLDILIKNLKMYLKK